MTGLLRKRSVAVMATVAVAAGTLGGIVSTPNPAAAASSPSVSVGDVGVTEGDAGSVVVSVPFDLSAPTDVGVTVPFTVQGGTATAGTDFRAVVGKVKFAARSANKLVSVTIYPDTITEGDETIEVVVGSPVNATVGDGTGIVTIADDDVNGVASGVEVNFGSVSVTEGDGGKHIARIPVSLSRPAPSTIKVQFATVCSSAALSSDVSLPSGGTITFLAGQQSKYVNVQVMADITGEALEELAASLQVTFGNALLAQPDGAITIYDTDGLPPVGVIERVSVASEDTPGLAGGGCGGQGGTYGAMESELSSDGRFVAFASDQVDLVPGDTNGRMDVFVRDRVNGTTERVNVDNNGFQTNGPAADERLFAMSADARFVVFNGIFSNSAAGSSWLRDRSTNASIPLSNYNTATVRIGRARDISDDGRYILVDATTNNMPAGLQRLDRITGALTVIGTDGLGYVQLSGDGSLVTFTSSSSTEVAGDTNNCNDVFVRNIATGATTIASLTDADTQITSAYGNGGCIGQTDMSSDGRYVVFVAASPELDAWPNGTPVEHVYRRDLVAGTTVRVDGASAIQGTFPVISDDGRYVAYSVQLVVNTMYITTTGYVVDLDTDVETQLAVLSNGTAANAPVLAGSISADGRFASFYTRAGNLTPKDANGKADVFVERIS